MPCNFVGDKWMGAMRACLLSRPSVLACVASASRGTCAPAPASLPLGGLPTSSASLGLGWVEAALQALAGAQGRDEVL